MRASWGDRLMGNGLILDRAGRRVRTGLRWRRLSELDFRLLAALADAGEAGLDRQALLATVWGRVVVSEATVKKRVSLLRRALGDDGNRYILNRRGEGYRLAVPVRSVAEARPGPRLTLAAGLLLTAGIGASGLAGAWGTPEAGMLPDGWAAGDTGLVRPFELEAAGVQMPDGLEAALQEGLHRAGYIHADAPLAMSASLRSGREGPELVIEIHPADDGYQRRRAILPLRTGGASTEVVGTADVMRRVFTVLRDTADAPS